MKVGVETFQPMWRFEDIDFKNIDLKVSNSNEDLLVLLCASSFIESGSEIYATNLSMYFKGDDDVESWINNSWEYEELQHGIALKTYISSVWPNFDWEAAFATFLKEYVQTCKVEYLEKTKALEMVARCVVETGTATLYRTINQSCNEPVLKQITGNIHADEVRHYKYFYRYFKRYNTLEGNSRIKILGTLLRRIMEIRNEDCSIALRHVYRHRYPETCSDRNLRQVHRRINKLVRSKLPINMFIKMLLKPLELPPVLQKKIQNSLASFIQFVFFIK